MRFKIDWVSLIVGSKFTVFALFYFVFEGKPPGGLIFVGRFNGGFFALRVWGAYFQDFVVIVQFLSLLLFEDTGISTIRQLGTR